MLRLQSIQCFEFIKQRGGGAFKIGLRRFDLDMDSPFTRLSKLRDNTLYSVRCKNNVQDDHRQYEREENGTKYNEDKFVHTNTGRLRDHSGGCTLRNPFGRRDLLARLVMLWQKKNGWPPHFPDVP